ncbi:MAG: hypothetical protein LW834_04380 [Cyanobium sp. 49614_E6]|nr:hypothetical protein [Cyanobium sp. 49614_E6]
MTLAPAAKSPSSFWTHRAPHALRPDEPRFICTATGIRLYYVPDPGGDGFLAVPGVTSILGGDQTPEEKERLEAWRLREIAAGRDPNAGRERGTRVHSLLEDYIRTGRADPQSEEDHAFFSGMEAYIEAYQEFLWNERPLRSGWEHCWSAPEGDPKRLARVWSPSWGFAGTPDLIAVRNGVRVVGDFKTSNKPYFRCHGSRVPKHQELGYKKYKKTVRQLCAYRLAIREILGLETDALHISVGLPQEGKAQQFWVQGPELEYETEQFKRMSVEFWQRFGETVQGR